MCAPMHQRSLVATQEPGQEVTWWSGLQLTCCMRSKVYSIGPSAQGQVLPVCRRFTTCSAGEEQRKADARSSGQPCANQSSMHLGIDYLTAGLPHQVSLPTASLELYHADEQPHAVR